MFWKHNAAHQAKCNEANIFLFFLFFKVVLNLNRFFTKFLLNFVVDFIVVFVTLVLSHFNSF